MTIVKNIPAALQGPRKDYPPAFREFKAKYGNLEIEKIKICKKPIEEVFEGVIDLVTQGKYAENKKKLNYDNMFHLFMALKLKGTEYWVRLEKNQVMNIGFIEMKDFDNFEKGDLGECIPIVGYKPKSLTLNELLDNAQKEEGDKFYLYNALNNNCQNFITNLLKHSGLLKPYADKFINQDVKNVLANIPEFSKAVIQGTTDIAGIFDVLLHGKGFMKKLKKRRQRKK